MSDVPAPAPALQSSLPSVEAASSAVFLGSDSSVNAGSTFNVDVLKEFQNDRKKVDGVKVCLLHL